ncbi:MAG: DUF3276 family protein [Luteibaculaceae bacterium]
MAEGFENRGGGEIFSKAVRAGKRTYFFDVKATKSKDLFLTITESRKLPGIGTDDAGYQKHKIFLYKEDFEKFEEGLKQTLEELKKLRESGGFNTLDQQDPLTRFEKNISDIDFDDL